MGTLPSGAKVIFGFDDGETTDINGVENDKNNTEQDDVWYSLSGQRVHQPQRGVYIHNGKKVVIK